MDLVPVNRALDPLIARFNEQHGTVRVIAVVSPT
jgi:hypothetical protein